LAGRAIHKLTDVQAKKSGLAPGRYADGGNLYLSVSTAGSKS